MAEDDVKKLEFDYWMGVAQIVAFIFLSSAIFFFSYFEYIDKNPNVSASLEALFIAALVACGIFLSTYFLRKAKEILKGLKGIKKKVKPKEISNYFSNYYLSFFAGLVSGIAVIFGLGEEKQLINNLIWFFIAIIVLFFVGWIILKIFKNMRKNN